jgi:hypothetical protein
LLFVEKTLPRLKQFADRHRESIELPHVFGNILSAYLYELPFGEHIAFVIKAFGKGEWLTQLKQSDDPFGLILKEYESPFDGVCNLSGSASLINDNAQPNSNVKLLSLASLFRFRGESSLTSRDLCGRDR